MIKQLDFIKINYIYDTVISLIIYINKISII